jgi:hypothetical protein
MRGSLSEVARTCRDGRKSVTVEVTAALEDGMGLGVAAQQAVSGGDPLRVLH